jgi:ribose 5-phosphate isomerase RpiB
MSVVSFDIDTIVRRVMADLLPQQMTAQRAPIAVPQAKSDSAATNHKTKNPNHKAESPAKQEPSAANKKLVVQLAGQLITLAVLDERIQGKWETVREIVVRTESVVTPSVRDLCYKKGIALKFVATLEQASVATESKNTAKIPAENRVAKLQETATVLLALHQMNRESEMLVQFLRQETLLEKASFDCIIETVEHLLKQFEQNPNQTAILVSNHYAAAGIVLANRYAKLRAVYGAAPEQVKHDAAACDANVLILPGDQLSGYQLRETARAFLTNRFPLSRRAVSTVSHSNNATLNNTSANNMSINNATICLEKLRQAFSERGTR